jgi:hypothetical protein
MYYYYYYYYYYYLFLAFPQARLYTVVFRTYPGFRVLVFYLPTPEASVCPVLGDRDVSDVEFVVEVSSDAVVQHSADAEEVEEELGGDAGVEL